MSDHPVSRIIPSTLSPLFLGLSVSYCELELLRQVCAERLGHQSCPRNHTVQSLIHRLPGFLPYHLLGLSTEADCSTCYFTKLVCFLLAVCRIALFSSLIQDLRRYPCNRLVDEDSRLVESARQTIDPIRSWPFSIEYSVTKFKYGSFLPVSSPSAPS